MLVGPEVGGGDTYDGAGVAKLPNRNLTLGAWPEEGPVCARGKGTRRGRGEEKGAECETHLDRIE
jgi:hypothetical protein